MAGIRKFEDIRAWQKARAFAGLIYEITRDGQFSRDFGLRDQIRRAAGSIMHNIAEGFDCGTDLEFRRFLGFSLRSATEVQSQLYMALDQGYIGSDQFKELYDQAEKIKADLRTFMAYLGGSKPHRSIREEGPDNSYYTAEIKGDQLADLGPWTSDPKEEDHED